MPDRTPYHRPRGTPSPREAAAAYRRRPDRAADNRFYASAAWRRLRALVLREEPLCRHCKAKGLTTAARSVDHIIDRKDRPDLALDRGNLQPLCDACHNAKRAGCGPRPWCGP